MELLLKMIEKKMWKIKHQNLHFLNPCKYYDNN